MIKIMCVDSHGNDYFREIKRYDVLKIGNDKFALFNEYVPVENYNPEIDFKVGMYVWNITHIETGMKVFSHEDKYTCMKVSVNKINKYPDAFHKARLQIIDKGIKMPINQI